jgi:hypothetical protein
VIGYNAVGNGSNTATIGNSSITANYFTGSVNGGSFVKSGGTSSQFLKADGSVDSSSYTPTTRTLTINGTAYDLSADRSWTISSDNIYTANGTLTGNRVVTMGANTLTFSGDIYVNQIRVGKGNGSVSNNTVFGFASMNSVSGSANTAFGYYALNSITTGSFNTAIGVALYSGATIQSNTAVGRNALAYLSIGSQNVAIGNEAGERHPLSVLTNCSNSIFIGVGTYAGADSQTNQIVIGQGATGLGSNTTIIGNASTITTALRGRLLLGTTTDTGSYQLDVNGTARVSGDLTVAGSNILTTRYLNMNSSLGSNRIEYSYSGSTLLQLGRMQGAAGLSRQFDLLSKTPDFGTTSQQILTLFPSVSIKYDNSAAAAGTTATETPSACFEIFSVNKGFLPPRMTNAQRTAISSPAVGLIVYCTDAVEGLYIYKSTGWTFVI